MPRREISFPHLPTDAPRPGGATPSVVIVGRPNVGKSSLLNCLAKKRIAIVDPTAGVTRDRISALLEHEGRVFELWDTGGIGTPDDLAAEVERQIETALLRADAVLFVVDVKQGLLPLDQEIAARLRRIGRPVILVVNKVEHARHEATAAAEFDRLGFAARAVISALHGHGRTDLLDEIVRHLPTATAAPQEPILKLAIVGRQNVGKSTLINTLAGEDRVIVSDLPGTTRDAVDVRFTRGGQTYLAVDTAGLKRRNKLADSVEFYSLERAHRAIRRCDVALFLIDIAADISRVDKELATAVEKEHKPCILVVNKWDLVGTRFTTEEYTRYLNDHLHGLSFAPVSFISARDRTNVDETLKLAQALFEQARHRVTTGQLNAVLQRAEATQSPRASHGKQPRLFYATQIAVTPPTILIFASHPQLISEQYVRYLGRYFREHLPFPEVPVRFVFRARTKKATGGA